MRLSELLVWQAGNDLVGSQLIRLHSGRLFMGAFDRYLHGKLVAELFLSRRQRRDLAAVRDEDEAKLELAD